MLSSKLLLSRSLVRVLLPLILTTATGGGIGLDFARVLISKRTGSSRLIVGRGCVNRPFFEEGTCSDIRRLAKLSYNRDFSFIVKISNTS